MADVRRAQRWSHKLNYIFKAPGWSHDGPDLRSDIKTRESSWRNEFWRSTMLILGHWRIAYAVGKLTGTRSCALCDITHGLNPFGKQVWRSYCEDDPSRVASPERNL